jgi:hypothetical protein
MRLAKRGKSPDVDYAITSSLISINIHRNKYAATQKERIWKLININDALDGLEGLIANKIELGLSVWGQKHKEIKKKLESPIQFAFSDPDGFNKIVLLRHKLYVDALTSLGYAATESDIVRMTEDQREIDESVFDAYVE